MAGYFELVDAPDGGYRIRLLDGAGNLMAISVTFPTKRAAVAGVEQAREIAGTGLIRDRSSGSLPGVAPVPTGAKRARGGTHGSVRGTLPAGSAAVKRARAHH